MLLAVIQGLSLLAAHAQLPPPTLVPEEAARVAEVIDGDTVLLDDGREVRLVGIQAPKLALGRAHMEDWPLALEAREALVGLVVGREVGIAFGGRPVDRHGRLLAHLVRDDGLWVQGWMLAEGWARVYSFDDNRTAIAEMLAQEEEARALGRGLWRHPDYAVLRAEDAERDPARFPAGTFQIVEGRVFDVGQHGRLTFVNFGRSYRTDFTIVIETGALRLFQEAGVDPAGWIGRTVRTRGWLYQHNGPAIEVTHPEQVELVDR